MPAPPFLLAQRLSIEIRCMSAAIPKGQEPSPMISISWRESALLVVDVQQGFTTLCPQELPVPGGLAIVPNVNRLLAKDWARIDASQDWHPPDHRSFLGQEDNLYPPHCVQGTPGADFVPGLDTQRLHTIWRKGYQRDFE